MDVVTVEVAHGASCRGGRHFEWTSGTLMWDHLWSWAEEEVESWVGVQESPAGEGAWGKVGELGTDLENWLSEMAVEGGKA